MKKECWAQFHFSVSFVRHIYGDIWRTRRVVVVLLCHHYSSHFFCLVARHFAKTFTFWLRSVFSTDFCKYLNQTNDQVFNSKPNIMSSMCSISGPAAAIYAYLSEFHNDVQRGRAIMSSSTIYGVSCLLAPLLAWSVINQDWQFDIPYIGITYKPWRLFLVVASLPSLLGFVILLFLPESPKFVLGQGKKEETHDILRRMNRINNGRNAELEDFDIYEEPESIENRKRLMESKESRFPLLTTIWVQTAPLFKPPYLFSTMLICAIQFGTYATSNGFYMFFAEILNKMASNLNDFTSPRIAMCDVINMNPVNLTAVNLNDTINEVSLLLIEI